MAARALVIEGAGGTTVITSVAVPVPPALLALIVTLVVPVALGVPLITPVLVLTLNPAGNPVAPNLVGLFVPAIW